MKTTISIGPFALGNVPLVVGVISSEHTLAHLPDLRPRPFDVAELRIDLIGVDTEGWLDKAGRLTEDGVPVILTLRHPNEGGHWYRDESERAKVYRASLPYVSAVDIEIHGEIFESLARDSRAAGKPIIGSFHDFTRTPSAVELEAVVREGIRKEADVIKLATFINADDDIQRLRGLLKTFADRPLCLLGMGPLGAETRVSLPLAGSCLTYGFVDQSSAPGQLSSAKLRERLVAEHAGYRALALTRN